MRNSIEEALEDIKNGRMIVVTDSENRENEGDLVMAADFVTAEHINFMSIYGKGLICAPINKDIANQFNLTPMINEEDKHGTAFTVSCDLRIGTTTGISAMDRAITIKALTNKDLTKSDFVRPGHIFPLIAKEGGVLEREGHTEAAVDLASLAGCSPCGVICEIINDDGTMARGRDLEYFCKKHKLKWITIEALKEYKKELFTKKPILIPTEYGDFYMETIDNPNNRDMPHLFIYKELNSTPLNVRIHSECLTGDLFGSLRCDCGKQLKESFKYISHYGGAILYLRQEGRGIGLVNKLRAYNLQDNGLDTLDANLKLGFKADEREYSIACDALKTRGYSQVNLITNNPEKVKGVETHGIRVVNRIPLKMESCKSNQKYLNTKRDRMGHLL
ncbi:MAG: 3,4-dihydroxy-2-butanone-4-phosphate synthase [Spirochaetales bacterium]|nr:3,4-dihydroxy-2-butanone-4-phosphate synthase [Spirochaetales bacterium]